jgi:hypothetical protein
MPVLSPSAQPQSAIGGVLANSPAANMIKQPEPTRERPLKISDEQMAVVALEPHWMATIDAATD